MTVRMLMCARCKSRVQSTIAIRSIGQRAYCTEKCMKRAMGKPSSRLSRTAV